MRAGEIAPSPFSLRVERNALAGALGLDGRRGSARPLPLRRPGTGSMSGPLLRRLRVARDIEVPNRHASGSTPRSASGGSATCWISRRSSPASSGAPVDVRDANSRAALRIGVDAGEVRANAGAPVTAAITGTIGTTPVALKAQAGRLREIVEADRRLPFSLTAETPGSQARDQRHRRAATGPGGRAVARVERRAPGRARLPARGHRCRRGGRTRSPGRLRFSRARATRVEAMRLGARARQRAHRQGRPRHDARSAEVRCLRSPPSASGSTTFRPATGRRSSRGPVRPAP